MVTVQSAHDGLFQQSRKETRGSLAQVLVFYCELPDIYSFTRKCKLELSSYGHKYEFKSQMPAENM